MRLHSRAHLPQLEFGCRWRILVRQGKLRCAVAEVVREVLQVVVGREAAVVIVGARPLVFGYTSCMGLASSFLESASQGLCSIDSIEAFVGGGGGTHALCDGHGTPHTLCFLVGRMPGGFLSEVVSAVRVGWNPRASHGCSWVLGYVSVTRSLNLRKSSLLCKLRRMTNTSWRLINFGVSCQTTFPGFMRLAWRQRIQSWKLQALMQQST